MLLLLLFRGAASGTTINAGVGGVSASGLLAAIGTSVVLAAAVGAATVSGPTFGLGVGLPAQTAAVQTSGLRAALAETLVAGTGTVSAVGPAAQIGITQLLAAQTGAAAVSAPAAAIVFTAGLSCQAGGVLALGLLAEISSAIVVSLPGGSNKGRPSIATQTARAAASQGLEQARPASRQTIRRIKT